MNSQFEVIVVGAGAAGCQLAIDLAAAGRKVALLEAGGYVGDVRSTVPIYYPKLFGSRFDYKFATESERGLRNRQVAWPRGRGIGGSTAINAQIYLQAANEDFERWEWDWAKEGLGELAIRPGPPGSVHPWSELFVEAARLQFKCEEPRSVSQVELNWTGIFQRFNQNGRRHHPGMLLGESATPIEVISDAHVLRLAFQGERATGVVCERDGSVETLAASQAVVLCAGVIGTPQLLIQSGIGNRDALKELQIDCRVDLEGVGKNLQDHLVYPLVYEVESDAGLPQRHNRKSREHYKQNGDGDLASNIAEAGAIFGTRHSEHCDFQIHFTPTHYLKYPRTARSRNHMSLAVSDLHPRSKGELRFEPGVGGQVQPKIYANYLSDEADVERFCCAISLARQVAQQAPLARLSPTEINPGRRGKDRHGLEKSLRSLAQSIYHPVGTCGHSSENGSVLNKEFRVTGVEGVYVADGSALPDLPSGNPAAVIMLLAKRVASTILA